jgi:predicted nucleic acid-binding protein
MKSMAHRRWVVNASPVILLSKTGYLGLLGVLTEEVAVPRAVVDEIGAKPDGDAALREINAAPSFVIVENEAATPEIFSWDLGAGETQVLAHALAHKAERVVIDDLEARRCAKAMGLGIIGTLGIVGRAKAMGYIDHAEPVVKRLRETGLYVSDELVRRLLKEVGE